MCFSYSQELDELRQLRDNSRKLLDELQTRLRAETGIGSLKVRENQLIGLFIEVPQSQHGRIPPSFTACQSLSGSARYKTAVLDCHLAVNWSRTD